jgi:RNase P subunit RPR2
VEINLKEKKWNIEYGKMYLVKENKLELNLHNYIKSVICKKCEICEKKNMKCHTDISLEYVNCDCIKGNFKCYVEMLEENNNE